MTCHHQINLCDCLILRPSLEETSRSSNNTQNYTSCPRLELEPKASLSDCNDFILRPSLEETSRNHN